MEGGEEGCRVPPVRKFSGVPSLAAFRRTALTPWNSEESGSGPESPPHSPHHLFQDNSKTKKNQVKEPVETASGKLSPLNGRDHSNERPTKEEADGLRIDRLFKSNGKNQLDRRRVRSSEPLGTRSRNPNLKSTPWTDGRDSIRLKSHVVGKERDRRAAGNHQNVRLAVKEVNPSRSRREISNRDLSAPPANSQSDSTNNNSARDFNKSPVIEITESSNEINTGEQINECDNQTDTKSNLSLNIITDLTPSENLERNNFSNKKSNENRVILANGLHKRSNSVRSLERRSPIPFRSRPGVRGRNVNSAIRVPSRIGANNKRISRVNTPEVVERKRDDSPDEPDAVKSDEEPETNYLEAEDKSDSTNSSSTPDVGKESSSGSSSESDDASDNSDDEEKRPENDKRHDDDSDSSTSDDDSSDKSESKSDLDTEAAAKQAPNDEKEAKKMDTLEVPTPKPNASPQQILRIHGVTLTKDKLKKLRSIVDKAAQRKKVFTIFGKYPSIREALVSRGWVQNFDLHKLTSPHTRQNDNEVSVYAKLRLGPGVGEEELALISRMLRDTPVHFVWIMGDTVDWKSLSKSTIVSRFPRVYFTTKVGLCSYLEESHWFCEATVATVNFPRCYTTDDLAAFIRDFRLTACLGLIRTLMSAVDNKQPNIFSGKIPLSAVKFAVKRCCEFVSVEEHDDIDADAEVRVWDHQWDQFLTYYYQLVHEGETFVSANQDQIQALYTCCQAALDGVKLYWPQLDMDGVTNLWLVKPGAKSRGRGISVCHKLEKIMAKLGSSNQPSTDLNPPASSSRFVIQKYVERPLLIHNTKFDIRQWFLVTSAYPLTIWMYKESYLRFCSQLFSLSNLHESVHLTNNAVQCRYRNQTKRDKALPDENMWDSYTFQAYLRTLGRRDEWESVVYPGMRESITGALLAAQDHMEPRPNCFELYGADFILTEDLKPWLIEINSSPAMSATTSVTARMCPQCLEDVIKVVIDRRSNRDAPTGQFELIYRQSVSTPQPYMGMNLTVRGSPAPRGKAPPAWAPPADAIQPPSHHANIQATLDSLADHLVGESDLLINSDEGCVSSLGGEEDSKESSEVSDKSGQEGKKRAEKRCALYKKHSCLGPGHRNYSSLGFNQRSHRLYKKQMRINSVLLSMRRVSVAPTSELMDWRQRVEHARALCNSAVAKMTAAPKQGENQATKRVKTDWNRTRRSNRKKKSKDKGKSVDDIRLWNEVEPETENGPKISLSENDNSVDSKKCTVISLSRSSKSQCEGVKSRVALSTKGKLYQEWKYKNRFNKTNYVNPESSILTVEPTKDTDITEEKVKRKKKKISPGRSPRSLSPSMNVRTGGSPRAPRSRVMTSRNRLSRFRTTNFERSPSPAFRSLSPRISPLTPGYFDLSNTSTSLEPKHYLSPFTASDLNNNWPLVNNQKYTFKSSSMINLPVLLRTK